MKKLTVTRYWKGLCPGELRNPFSSCCGRWMTKNANITRKPEPIMVQMYPVLIWHPRNLKTAIGWNSAFALQHASAWLWTSCTSCLCAKSTHTRHRREERLEEQSSTACGRRLCGIRWDWHFCWWPAKAILCEGWLNHQPPSGKRKTSNVTTQDCLQSGTWFI